MIVIVGVPDAEDQRYIEDAAALVVDASGLVRICRDGKEDEHLPADTSICVVPS